MLELLDNPPELPAATQKPLPKGLLLEEVFVEQAKLGSAVARFSEWHDRREHAAPLQERHYKKLIPLNKPGAGEQYAFEVNLDQCTGCKACVVACHSLNGLDDQESWRDVGVMVGATEDAYLQTVTTACHHCVDPACANGCPVLAYEKDADSGIVRHLDDQCIGCAYCMMKCPYDVPKWNAKRGIVRKCDMCHQRLSAGEAPACVQSCPNEAIAIRIVKMDEVAERSTQAGARLLPQTFRSSYTKPTTRYVTEKELPNGARDGGAGELRLEEPHWPLAWMLVLTQMAAGLLTAGCLLPEQGGMGWVNRLAAPALAAGIALSVLHLGQPLRAWRCFLGLRKSWLSREIVVFGAFLKLTLLAAWMPLLWTTAAGAATGLLGVYCSVMVYADTQRPFWKLSATALSFFGNTVLLGNAGAAMALSWAGHSLTAFLFATVAMLVRVLLFAWEQLRLRRAWRDAGHEMRRPAQTMKTLKGGVLRARLLLFSVSTLATASGMLGEGVWAGAWMTLAFVGTLVSQLLERHLFFVAVDAPRVVSASGPQLHHPVS